MSNNTTKPLEEVRIGAVKAAIWRNVANVGNNSRPMYSVTFQRLYRDGDNAWKSTESFGRDDLLLLAKVAERAFDRIHEIQQAGQGSAQR